MSFDFFNYEITAEQAKVHETSIEKRINTLQHGQSGYVESYAWWVHDDGGLWIDGHSTYVSEEDAEELLDSGELDCLDAVRVIRIKEDGFDGFAVDASSYDEKPGTDGSSRIDPYDHTKGDPQRSHLDPMPAIAWTWYENESQALSETIERQFGIKLGQSAIKLYLQNQESSDPDKD